MSNVQDSKLFFLSLEAFKPVRPLWILNDHLTKSTCLFLLVQQAQAQAIEKSKNLC